MRRLCREFDWGATPLGPANAWPPALVALLQAVLDAPLPMALIYGPDRTVFFNDAYAEDVLGADAAALGRPAAEEPRLGGTGAGVRVPLRDDSGRLCGELLIVPRPGAEEAERARIAKELHDEAGQRVTALALQLRAVSEDVPPGSALARAVAELRTSVNALGEELHRIVVRLRPSALDDFGLVPALDALPAEWAKSGLTVEVLVRIGDSPLASNMETAIYRMVQEALTNVARHSGVTRARVLVERRDAGLAVWVHDGGRGFDPATIERPGGFGLAGMRERVTAAGGNLEIVSAPDEGTTLFGWFPTGVR